jgi:predicted nucleic acid-binding Zn ribbon protein
VIEPNEAVPPAHVRRWPAPRRATPGVDPGPRPLSDTLDVLVGHLGQGDAGAFGAVFARWEEIAGEKMAEHVQPLRISEDLLVLRADHQAWATQVRALGPSLLAQVGKVTGSAPARIEVVVRAS